MNTPKLKLNRAVNFRTNEDLYYDFALKCKLNKQKIGDRLNALMTVDLQVTIPSYVAFDKDLHEKIEISQPDQADA